MNDRDESIFDLISKSDKSTKSEKTCSFAVSHLATDNVYCIISGKVCAETLAQNWADPKYCKLHAEAFRMGLQRMIEPERIGGRFEIDTRRPGATVRRYYGDPPADPTAAWLRKRHWERHPERERMTDEQAARFIDITGMDPDEASEALDEARLHGPEYLRQRYGTRVRFVTPPAPTPRGRGIVTRSWWHMLAIICGIISWVLGIIGMTHISWWLFPFPTIAGVMVALLIKEWRQSSD